MDNKKSTSGLILKCLIVLWIGLATCFILSSMSDYSLKQNEIDYHESVGDLAIKTFIEDATGRPMETKKKEFTVPADGKLSENWMLPPSENGWMFEVKYSGDLKWYPNAKTLEEFIPCNPGQSVDLGQFNPTDMNFCFSSATGKTEQVTVYYWPKKNV